VRRAILVVLAVVVTACGADQPSSPLRTSADVARGAALEVRADGCGPRRGFGTASLVSDHLAVTAAHVVAGASSVAVIDQNRIEHVAEVVHFDPDLDVAVLRLPDQLGTPATLSSTPVEVGDAAALTVFRASADERGPTDLNVEVVRRANVTTTDIYLEGEVLRPGFEITGTIVPGDSGALVVLDGVGVGVLWARSTANEGRSWVVNIPGILRGENIETDSLFNERVGTGDCIR
jgi:S1-C subfamily serine protease